MPMFSTAQLADWSGGAWRAAPATACRGICHDTRRLAPGHLYVALRGERTDGHRFVPEAFQKGALAALVDASYAGGLSGEDPGPLLVVEETGQALWRLAAGHRQRLRARVIGITGSLGKTTVKEMTAAILAEEGPTARSPGSWNNAVGVPMSLLGAEPGDAFGVFEVGMNHPGELAPLCALVRPDAAIMTRVGPVHSEFFPGEEAIAEEKAELLRALPSGGLAILASDEPWFDLLARSGRGRVVTVAFDAEADYRGRMREDGDIEVREPAGEIGLYPVPLPGEPARRNALRAVAAGREHGVSPARIASALSRFRPLPLRGQETRRRDVLWINDAYNANPLSMAAALETFAGRPVAGCRWVVLGTMAELAEAQRAHRELGRAVARNPWAGAVFVGAQAEAMAAGACDGGFPPDRMFSCRDAKAAARILDGRLRAGDAVLLKGSRSEGMERVETLWEAGAAGGEMD